MRCGTFSASARSRVCSKAFEDTPIVSPTAGLEPGKCFGGPVNMIPCARSNRKSTRASRRSHVGPPKNVLSERSLLDASKADLANARAGRRSEYFPNTFNGKSSIYSMGKDPKRDPTELSKEEPERQFRLTMRCGVTEAHGS
jgi:hypothetical protein